MRTVTSPHTAGREQPPKLLLERSFTHLFVSVSKLHECPEAAVTRSPKLGALKQEKPRSAEPRLLGGSRTEALPVPAPGGSRDPLVHRHIPLVSAFIST